MSSPTDPAAHASVMLEYSAGELAAYKFLTTVEGRAALEACRQLPTLAVSDILRLRKQWGELLAQALIAQHALTGSLIEKFGNADRLATNRSLQQASDAITAAYKAERFPRDANVIDWCCGMGGDLTALSMRTSARGIDRDPWLCLMASANAPRAQVICGDVTEHLPTQHDFLHADPDRRPGEQKTSQPEFGSPPLEIIDRAIHVAAGAAIKLAPAAEVPAHWSLSAERQWISLQGSCRQQIVWFGLTNDPGKHRATRLNRQGQASEFCAVPIDRCDVTDQIGRYLYDPDPALRAAQLTCCWAVKFQTAALGGPAGFLTSDRLVQMEIVPAFEVLESCSLDPRRLKECVRRHEVDVQEVKIRGIDRAPESLRRSLRNPGSPPATLIVGRSTHGPYAALTRRCIATDPIPSDPV